MLSEMVSSELHNRIDDLKRAENEERLNKLEINEKQKTKQTKNKRDPKTPKEYEFRLDYS